MRVASHLLCGERAALTTSEALSSSPPSRGPTVCSDPSLSCLTGNFGDLDAALPPVSRARALGTSFSSAPEDDDEEGSSKSSAGIPCRRSDLQMFPRLHFGSSEVYFCLLKINFLPMGEDWWHLLGIYVGASYSQDQIQQPQGICKILYFFGLRFVAPARVFPSAARPQPAAPPYVLLQVHARPAVMCKYFPLARLQRLQHYTVNSMYILSCAQSSSASAPQAAPL